MKNLTLLFFLVTFNAFGQNSILWSIKDTASGKTSYLLGTLHQMGNSFVDGIPEIENSLKSSELAIFESIDDENIVVDLINAREDNLETIKFLENKDFNVLKEMAKSWKSNIYKLTPAEIILKLEQSIPSTLCGNVKESDRFSHFDNYLIYRAKQNGIPIFGFETNAMQIQYINQDNVSKYDRKEKKKILDLCKILTEKDTSKYDCKFFEKYKRFELDYRLTNSCSNDILLKQRNENWMPIILEKIKKQNCFIAVGLFHLYKDCGLINQLRNYGFIVEPIMIKKS